MDRRLPARVLALLALVGVSVALFAVVTRSTAGPDAGSAPAAETTSGEDAAPAAEEAQERPKAPGRRRYTVKSGDTPSGIAEKTGVSVERLLELNPDLDAQALQTGQRLKLR